MQRTSSHRIVPKDVLNFLLTIYWKNRCYLVVLLHSLHYKGVEENSVVWCWQQWSFSVLIFSCKEKCTSIKVVLISCVALALKVAIDFISQNLKVRLDWTDFMTETHLANRIWFTNYRTNLNSNFTSLRQKKSKQLHSDFLYPYTNLDCLETLK